MEVFRATFPSCDGLLASSLKSLKPSLSKRKETDFSVHSSSISEGKEFTHTSCSLYLSFSHPFIPLLSFRRSSMSTLQGLSKRLKRVVRDQFGKMKNGESNHLHPVVSLYFALIHLNFWLIFLFNFDLLIRIPFPYRIKKFAKPLGGGGTATVDEGGQEDVEMDQ